MPRVLWIIVVALLISACSEFDYASDRHLREAGVRSGGAGAHVVQSGDTLYQIAWEYGVDFRDLARWNAIPAPYVIYPGQRLAVRASAASPSSQSASRGSSTPQSSATGTSRAQSSGISGPVAWQWPLSGEIVKRYQANAMGKRGISIAAPPGTTVKAAGGGSVVYSGNGLRGYGNLIIIKHNDQFLTAYGYNQSLLVGEGDQVSAGDAIARVGASLERAGELHFEVRRQGKPVNPTSYLPAQ